VLPVDRDRRDAGLIVDEQDFLPRLAAVFRAVNAALRSPAEGLTDRRHVRDVRILRVDLQLRDLADFAQPDVRPRLAGVGRLVDAASDDDVRSDGFAAGAHVDHVRIRIRDVDRADRSGRDLAVGDWQPGDPVVLGLPDAAARRAHIEDVRLRAYARGRR